MEAINIQSLENFLMLRAVHRTVFKEYFCFLKSPRRLRIFNFPIIIIHLSKHRRRLTSRAH